MPWLKRVWLDQWVGIAKACTFVHDRAGIRSPGGGSLCALQSVEVDMHLASKETPMSPARGTGHSVRIFMMACGTFASNVVERFHEYADARLAEELTIVEQRRRLLAQSEPSPGAHQRTLVHRTVHVD